MRKKSKPSQRKRLASCAEPQSQPACVLSGQLPCVTEAGQEGLGKPHQMTCRTQACLFIFWIKKLQHTPPNLKRTGLILPSKGQMDQLGLGGGKEESFPYFFLWLLFSAIWDFSKWMLGPWANHTLYFTSLP